MKSLIENRFSLLVLVLVALLALYGVAYATQPPAVTAPAPGFERVPVASVTAVCPAPGDTSVGVVAPPGSREPGSATLVTGDKTLATVDAPGRLWHDEVPASSPPLVVAADGSMAAGLEVAQTRREKSGKQRGTGRDALCRAGGEHLADRAGTGRGGRHAVPDQCRPRPGHRGDHGLHG
ncbi:hypothetical protein [Streptosporangium vulgare]|uniref:hypothetical protein n=1 Tax=Streptosporangium vulgare TaxID=46190 RepID=UPI003379F6B6